MTVSLSRIGKGVGMMPRALRYLWNNPSLLPWVLAPTVLTLCTIAAGVAATVVTVPLLVAQFLPQPANPGLLWVWWVGVVLLMMSVLTVSVVVAWVVGNILSAPFYDVIAGRVENAELGTQDGDFAWRRIAADASISIRDSLLGLLLYILVLIPLFALNLVPVIGSALYAVMSVAVTVFFVSREVMDVPLSRRQMGFLEKIRYINTHRERVGGHGAVVALLLLIPLANVLVTPVAVLGAALLFCDIERERETPTRRFRL